MTRSRFTSLPSFLPLLGLIVTVVLSDLRIFGFDFQQGWDDQWVAVNHYTDHGFTFDNLRAILSEFYHGQYAPVNQIYYTALRHFFGYNPVAFHACGVLLHLFNTVLCYVLLLRVLIGANLVERNKALVYSFWASALFASSPINLEPTAWIAASKILIYALFYLLALISYTSYLKERKPFFYYLTILFFVLSFGGKEQAVTLPVCLVLLDLIFKRSLRDSLVWLEKAPMFILSIYFGVLTLHSQQIPEDAVFEYSYSLPEKLLIVPYTLVEYFIKCFLPYKLSYLYPFPFPPMQTPPKWLVVYPFLAIAVIPMLIFGLRKRLFFFSLIFFLIHIALASNIISLARYAVVADRYAYIASIAVALLTVHGIFSIDLQLLKSSKVKLAILSGVLIFYVSYTNLHSKVWANTYTLKRDFRSIIKGRSDYNTLKEKSIENEHH